MSDWPGCGGKMTSYNNLKLSFSERPWDVDRDYFCWQPIGVWLLGSKSRLIESVSEYESVPQICIKENFHVIIAFYGMIDNTLAGQYPSLSFDVRDF